MRQPRIPSYEELMEQAWYVGVDGEPRGPYNRHTVVAMFANGTIESGTLVWRAGLSAWATSAEAGLGGAIPPALPERASAKFLLPTRPIDAAAGESPPDLVIDDDGWQDLGPAPWSRYLARGLDMLIAAIVLWVIPAVVREATQLTPAAHVIGTGRLLVLSFITSMMVTPLQALTLGLTGSTAGKWLFGVRVTRPDGRPLGIITALKRELSVYLFGMGLGFPFIAQLAQFRSYNTLVNEHQTSWDTNCEWVVTHRPPGAAASVFFVIGLTLLIGAIIVAWNS